MECPQCGASNEAQDSFCNACGYNFSSQMKIVRMDQPSKQRSSSRRKNRQGSPSKFIALWLLSTIFIFLVVIFLFKG